MLEVVLVDGPEMAGDFARVKNLADTADERQPRAKHTVGKAAAAILVFRAFLVIESDGFG